MTDETTLSDRYGAGVEKAGVRVGITIDWLGGNCPVQAEGSIDGKRFYFRARGEHWEFRVSESAETSANNWPDFFECFCHEEEWGDGPYDAGWMPEDVARQMIAKGAEAYRATLTTGGTDD